MAWTERNGRLEAQFEFADFTDAFAFMTSVASIANELGHHPEWSNVYNRVSIALTTHDKGNVVTDLDRSFANAVDELLARSR